jgi:hypothetical protein
MCIPNHVSVSAPTHYGVCWHHLQGAPSNRQFFAVRPMIANNLVERSLQDRRLFNTDAQHRKSLNFLQRVYVCVCWNISCIFWRSLIVSNLVPSDSVLGCNCEMCVLCPLAEVPLSISVYLLTLLLYILGGTRWRSWLRHCATSWKVTGSIPDGINGIFHWHNHSGRTIALGLTLPLTEMSTKDISWGVKAAGA